MQGGSSSEYSLLGILIADYAISDLISYITESIQSGQKAHIITLNPEMVARQATDGEFYQALHGAELRIVDGNGILLAARILGKAIQHRTPGIELVEELLRVGQEKSWSFYFLGSSSEVVTRLVKNLKIHAPKTLISGFHHGYFQDSLPIIEDINRSKPDILLVGLGSPQQELWIHKNRNLLQASIMIGIGGSFDVLCGDKKRAPFVFRKMKLEWLYRIASEPHRLKRVIPAFFRFGWMVLKERLVLK
ncbi:MAG TPA: WecB/TagA/CpsF family glycosyltransferase [Atribacter sp.]|jgi:N-acetylglucosaminyldiphosphoundecaprenol N-acetyl-beta-D-mannosaminyltransferase|uniref:WecB/TagA/CpsF family glycosyltransferase n=1 Tax=Atribacter sp. TaxID=2847780 RepID=UPI001761535A|nr:WecB/TagA/CpsF family glycosyltransferase [Atribacter sp.]MDD3714657.1 WecB/TagA/CpsF family glycosyltransferase [Atribacterota bacterium]MDI9593807.1 WecB/TagA/CpsF family glycosyltransferase [Atribacterota bacterium]HHT10347.1 WecB/TagA/CpsF family glycosyltransferase [Candidatus Atribacteria bacterium]HQK82501.1 WecB/TagA/CpsF family glycosyltransferase [Atribacter sp.]